MSNFNESLAARLTLLSRVGEQSGDAADMAYQHILHRIKDAQVSVEVFMYVWRADAVGHLMGRVIIEAADRGVKVKIFKDRGALLFESQESNRKPFFRTPCSRLKRIVQRGVGMTFPQSYIEDDWNQDLGDRLIDHPNVEFLWVSPTHTKYYCIDEIYLITGSLNLEDRHRGYHDVMVEVAGARAVQHFRRDEQGVSQSGDGSCQLAEGSLQVLCNDPQRKHFAIKPAVLGLIKKAQVSIHIEMAYVGDEEVTGALIDAGQRGVRLSILFSAKSNIGNDVNFYVLRQLMQQADIDVRLSSKMIHSKVMVVDDEKVLMGSANFSIFSMQRAGEMSLLIDRDMEFIRQINAVLSERWELGVGIEHDRELPKFWRTLAVLQQWHQRTSNHQ